YDDIAHRLIYRWLYTITRNATDYNGTVPEKFDVVGRSHHVFAEYGNVGTKFAFPKPQIEEGPKDDMQVFVNVRGSVEDFKKLIVLPFYTISDVEIKFENDEKAEIVLSTC
ncbi:MAG: hypothetical protein GY749_05710, partial [Desulfobacteraceae bacterium]|nr:hypothetical protein [Desulfobacteraceae bacterium]